MKKGKTVETKSYCLPPTLIEWIEEYGKKSHRNSSQIICLAIEMLRNKVCNTETV